MHMENSMELVREGDHLSIMMLDMHTCSSPPHIMRGNEAKNSLNVVIIFPWSVFLSLVGL